MLELLAIVLLLHVGFYRKSNRMNAFGKNAVLWSVDFLFSVIALFLLMSTYDFTPNKIETVRFLWPLAGCVLLVLLLFGIGPSGFAILVRRKRETKRNSEAVEWQFNQVMSGIRSCIFVLLFCLLLMNLTSFLQEVLQPVTQAQPILLLVCLIILAPVSLRQCCYYFYELRR